MFADEARESPEHRGLEASEFRQLVLGDINGLQIDQCLKIFQPPEVVIGKVKHLQTEQSETLYLLNVIHAEVLEKPHDIR